MAARYSINGTEYFVLSEEEVNTLGNHVVGSSVSLDGIPRVVQISSSPYKRPFSLVTFPNNEGEPLTSLDKASSYIFQVSEAGRQQLQRGLGFSRRVSDSVLFRLCGEEYWNTCADNPARGV